MGALAEELEDIKAEVTLLEGSLTVLRDASEMDGVVDVKEQASIDELVAVIMDTKARRDKLEADLARAEQEAIEQNAEAERQKAEDDAKRKAADDKDRAEEKAAADEDAAQREAAERDAAIAPAEDWPEQVRATVDAALPTVFDDDEATDTEEEADSEYRPMSDSDFYVAFYQSLIGWVRDVKSGLNSALGYASTDEKSDKVKASDISGLIALTGHPAAQGVDTAVKVLETITKIAEQSVSGGSETQTINVVHDAMRKGLNQMKDEFQQANHTSWHYRSFCAHFAKQTGQFFYMPSSSGKPELYLPEKKFINACRLFAKDHLPGEDKWMRQFMAAVLASLPDSWFSQDDQYEDMWSGFDAGYAYIEIDDYIFGMRLRSMTINDGGGKVVNGIKTVFRGKSIIDVPLKIAIVFKSITEDRTPATLMTGKNAPLGLIKRDSTTPGSLNFKTKWGGGGYLERFLKERFYNELNVSKLE